MEKPLEWVAWLHHPGSWADLAQQSSWRRSVSASTQMHCSYQHKAIFSWRLPDRSIYFLLENVFFFWWPFHAQRNYQCLCFPFREQLLNLQSLNFQVSLIFQATVSMGKVSLNNITFSRTLHILLCLLQAPLTKPHFLTFGFMREQKSLLSGVRKPPRPFFLYFQR